MSRIAPASISSHATNGVAGPSHRSPSPAMVHTAMGRGGSVAVPVSSPMRYSHSPMPGPSQVIRRCYPVGYQPLTDETAHKGLGRDAAKRNRQTQFANDPLLKEIKREDACQRCRTGGWRCFVNPDPLTFKKRCETCGTNLCTFSEVSRDRVIYVVDNIPGASSAAGASNDGSASSPTVATHPPHSSTRGDETVRLSSTIGPLSRSDTVIDPSRPAPKLPGDIITLDQDALSGLNTLADALFPNSTARSSPPSSPCDPARLSVELPDVPDDPMVIADDLVEPSSEAGEASAGAGHDHDLDGHTRDTREDVEMVSLSAASPVFDRPTPSISPRPLSSRPTRTSRPDRLAIYQDPTPTPLVQAGLPSPPGLASNDYNTGKILPNPPISNAFTFVAPRTTHVKAKDWPVNREHHYVFRIPLRSTTSQHRENPRPSTSRKAPSTTRPLFIEKDGVEILDIGALSFQ